MQQSTSLVEARDLATSPDGLDTGALLGDLRVLIQAASERVASAADTELVTLYWQVGRRVRADVLRKERAEYGRRIIEAVSDQLTEEYGKGFDRSNLFRMIQFAERFTDEQIVATLSRQLGWSHFVAIIPLDDPLQREFYAEMCRVERFSVRTPREVLEKEQHEAIRTARERLSSLPAASSTTGS